MDRPGREGRGAAPGLDDDMRATAAGAVARWRRRLQDSRGPGLDQPLPQALAIAREAAQLSGLARSRGADSLARAFEAIEAGAAGPPHALAVSVEGLAAHLESVDVAGHSVGASSGKPAAGAAVEMPVGVPDARATSMTEPPLLEAGDAARSGEGGAKSVKPRRDSSAASSRAPAPNTTTPPLVGPVLGLRAFGRKEASDSRPAAANGRVLGLGGRRREQARPAPAPPSGARASASDRVPPYKGGAVDHDGPRGPSETALDVADRARTRLPPWSLAIVGTLGVLAAATAVVIARPARAPNPSRDAPPIASAAPSASPSAMSPPAGLSSSAADQSMIGAVHRRGSETPQLRALLETQGRLALACKSDPSACGRGWTPRAREALSPVEGAAPIAAPGPGEPLAAWLRRLRLPGDLPIRDNASLRALFDLNTKNIAGRQRFQAKLFDCAAYADIFDSTLVKYGAPSWLPAVVYQESACNPRATSEVGAKGLWQFMPESGRAYGLRVEEGEIDERLNPIKSTEAAVHFLTDLQRKLGAWDLVFAAYNMGPFAVLARLAQVGDGAGFWDLAGRALLPEETASYVPAVESYALVLENLSRLQFSRDGKRLESTAEIAVKPAMRLSLLARAASTTTLHIRDLNPEFLRDVVPDGETTARVPDAEAHRAQAFLEAWSPDDNRDTCVPEDFDWGAKPFETSRFARNCPQPAASR